MSGLGGAGGFLARIIQGAGTALGQLAQYFRLPGFSAVESPLTPQPGRPQLTTPEQVAEALAARNLAPPTASVPRYNAFYVCVATDEDTGAVLARILHNVEYAEGTARSTIYSAVRRYAIRQLPYYLPGEDISDRNISWSCRLIRRTKITP